MFPIHLRVPMKSGGMKSRRESLAIVPVAAGVSRQNVQHAFPIFAWKRMESKVGAVSEPGRRGWSPHSITAESNVWLEEAEDAVAGALLSS